jgi:hypothetical protein
MERNDGEFNYGGANHGRAAPQSQASSHLGAVIICGRILSHSVRNLFVVHLVSSDKVVVNSVGHVRNENER